MKKKKEYIFNFHYNKIRSRELRRKETKAEMILWKRLRNRQIEGLKFRRQHPIGYYISDFYCHEKKLIIELEGGVHEDKYQKDYDKLRKEEIEGWQYIIIYFKNEEIYNNLENVIDIIKETVNKIETTPLLAERVGEGQG